MNIAEETLVATARALTCDSCAMLTRRQSEPSGPASWTGPTHVVEDDGEWPCDAREDIVALVRRACQTIPE